MPEGAIQLSPALLPLRAPQPYHPAAFTAPAMPGIAAGLFFQPTRSTAAESAPQPASLPPAPLPFAARMPTPQIVAPSPFIVPLPQGPLVPSGGPTLEMPATQAGPMPLAPLIECQRCGAAQQQVKQAQQQVQQAQQIEQRAEQQASQPCATCGEQIKETTQTCPCAPGAAPSVTPAGTQLQPGAPGNLAPLIENPALTHPATIPAAQPVAPSGAPALFTQGQPTGPAPSEAQVANPVKICVACTTATEAAKFLNGEPSECSVLNN